MKKLFFAAHSLDIGGIETALVTLLNELSKRGYEITLGLEKKKGIFLNEINSNVNILEYNPSEVKFTPIRKLINLSKRIKFILLYKNKFDFSASFATYSLPAGFMATVASKNSALWVHADYLSLFHGDLKKVEQFFISINEEKYKNIIFVSNEAKMSFLKAFPQENDKCIVCNNAINYEKIKEESEEQIEEKRDTRVVTFLNVGRHDERQKKLTRLIEVCERLKQEGEKFRVFMIGDGKDNKFYRELVKDKNLNDEVIFLGRKKNPYPYFKISDCEILTSDYEGYPVVFVEAFVLGLPIITTDVSDSKEEIDGKYGYVTKKDKEDIYKTMKKFIKEGYMIKDKFRPEEFNNEIINKLERIF